MAEETQTELTDETHTGEDVEEALESLDDEPVTGTSDKPLQKLQQEFGTFKRQMEQQQQVLERIAEGQQPTKAPAQDDPEPDGTDDPLAGLDDTELVEGRHLKKMMDQQMKAINSAIKPIQKQMQETDQQSANEKYRARLVATFPDAENVNVQDTLIDLADKRLNTIMPDLTGSEREAALRATLLQVAGEAAARSKSKGKKPRKTTTKSTEGTEIAKPGATLTDGDLDDDSVERGRKEIEDAADSLEKALRGP